MSEHQTREKQLEQVLRDLIQNHFYSKELQWSWIEGCSIHNIDFDLYQRICALIPETVAKK